MPYPNGRCHLREGESPHDFYVDAVVDGMTVVSCRNCRAFARSDDPVEDLNIFRGPCPWEEGDDICFTPFYGLRRGDLFQVNEAKTSNDGKIDLLPGHLYRATKLATRHIAEVEDVRSGEIIDTTKVYFGIGGIIDPHPLVQLADQAED